MNQETNKCSFCGEIKPVLRQYLHAKNKEHIDDNKHTPFTITYYCSDCGIQEDVDAFKEALIWCSGSDDFQVGGKAREGWEKLCKPLI